jgi:RNase adapter protein RapZ
VGETSQADACWLLTGMSGAGKATAAAALERGGVTVTDNLPAPLLPDWAAASGWGARVAVVDARQGDAILTLVPPRGVRVLFLDAAEPVLVKRLGESTRPHPCAAAGGSLSAIRREREVLTGLRAAADTVLDSGDLTPAQLARLVVDLVRPSEAPPPFRLTVSSFGYKFGSQPEADWIVDARFLRNPFWDPALRPSTGLDEAVRAYVFDDPRSEDFSGRLTELLRWTVAQYAGHGRNQLHVAVGCTGGRHRSVVLAEELGRRLRGGGLDVAVRHRDVDKPDPR